MKCILRKCGNRFSRLTKIPTNKEARETWLRILRREDLAGSETPLYVCLDHFRPEMFGPKGNRLTSTAVPFYEEHNGMDVEFKNNDVSFQAEDIESSCGSGIIIMEQSQSTQTEKSFGVMNLSLEERRKKIKGMQKKLATPKVSQIEANENNTQVEFLTQAKNLLPSELFALVESFVLNSNRQKKGVRYTDELKQLSLSIYHMSPLVYRYLTKCFKCLPCENTLRAIVQKWPTGPGLKDIYFQSLQLKAQNLPAIGKNCMICIDEMALHPHTDYDRRRDMIIGLEDDGKTRTQLVAKSAVVYMVRGITHQYRQLVGYAFVNTSCPAKQLKEMLFDIIKQLRQADMQPRGIVCDQGSNFISLSKLLGISPECSHFKVEECDDKIFFFFDAPHLIKSIRNNLSKSNIEFGHGKVASWDHVKEFYKKDKQQNFKLAPKLTRHHIYPSNFKKMRVKLATQVFSYTVAAGIHTRASNGQITQNALETAEFLKSFDGLFDIFNSNRFSERKVLRRPFKATPNQMDYLLEMKNLLLSIKIIDKEKDITSKVKCIKGWLISLNSLIGLFSILKETNVEFLLTRHLNQDCLEHTFGMLRKMGGNNRNPTPLQFTRAFKKVFSSKYLEIIKDGNCEEDKEWQAPAVRLNFVEEPQISISNNIDVSADVPVMDMDETNAFYYVGGYILKRYLESHSCNIHSETTEREETIYIRYKEYAGCTLVKPPDAFMDYIYKLEDAFCSNFNNLITKHNICKTLVNIFDKLPYTPCCETGDKIIIIKSFLAIRLKSLLKRFNSSLDDRNVSQLLRADIRAQ